MIKVSIGKSYEYSGVVVRITSYNGDSHQRVKPFALTFTPTKIGEYIEPSLVLNQIEGDELLRALAQGLAEAGYFPDVMQNKQDELTATKYHLEDMRKLVFKEAK